MHDAPAYLVIVWLLAWLLLVGCISAAIVELAGASRLGRLLRLDVRDDDE